MVALLAIWLRSLTMVASVNLATAKKDGCAKNGPNTDHMWESIGDTDHMWESIGDKDRQSVNLATTKKNGCATSYGCAPGNMVASVSLATLKKEVARPPMVVLLAIWLRLLTMVASVNLATAKKRWLR